MLQLFVVPESRKVSSLCYSEVREPHAFLPFSQLRGYEEDQTEVFAVGMLLKYVLVTVDDEGDVRLHDFVIVDDDLVWDIEVSFLRSDGSFCGDSNQVTASSEGHRILNGVVDYAMFFQPLVEVDEFRKCLQCPGLLPVDLFHVLDFETAIQLINDIVYHLPAIIYI